MAEQSLVAYNRSEAPNTERVERSRSRQYPSTSLPELVPQVRHISDAVGFGPAAADTVAQAMNYSGKNGASMARIAAHVHFGLLEIAGKGSYRLTELAKRIILPVSDSDQAEAIAQAATNPKLYTELVGRFAGHTLPTLLPNILARDFGIMPQQTQEVATDFRKTVEYAGLLRNGVLHNSAAEVQSATTDSASAVDLAPVASPASSAHQVPEFARPASIVAQSSSYTIPLTKGRVGVLQLPVPVALSDVDRLKKWLDLMSEVLTESDNPEVSAN